MGQNKTTTVANLFLTTIVVRVLVLSASALYWIFFFTDLEYCGGGSFFNVMVGLQIQGMLVQGQAFTFCSSTRSLTEVDVYLQGACCIFK